MNNHEAGAIVVGSRTYTWPGYASAGLCAVRRILEDEENRILEIAPLLTQPEEHILIHFVRMYLFRFAIPAVEIERGRLSPEDVESIRERLWQCFLGRALDDLVDQDSKFFSAADSALLLVKYSSLLIGQQRAAADSQLPVALLKAMATAGQVLGAPTPQEPLTFDGIVEDVCRRVDYFLLPTAQGFPARLQLLRRFLGVTLGGCDLDDALADGDGRHATRVSRALHAALADDEGKVLLGRTLREWYATTAATLIDEGEKLAHELTEARAPYAASVVQDEVQRIRKELE